MLHILLLEDEESDAELIKRKIHTGGIVCSYVIASDKNEFIRAMSNESFDVILADNSLPQFSSEDALAFLKQKEIDTPFILVTGTVSEEFAVNILHLGADDYILKGNMKRLPSSIKAAIAKRKEKYEKEKALTDLRISEHKLKENLEQTRHLAASLQHIREEERTTIARDIHDQLGQMLTALRLEISNIKSKMPPENSELIEKLGAAVYTTDEVLGMVRKIASSLRPAILDDMGLAAAMEWQSREFRKTTGILSTFYESGTDENIDKGLFRLFQEALTNIIRHANATKVVSTLNVETNQVMLTVNDNGIGFEWDPEKSITTLGLTGMRERVIMMQGEFEINSSTENGTLIMVKVPL
jgi:signal transduction histidine kinase